MPLFVTVCEVKRLQVSSNSGEDHFALLAIDAVVKSIILDMPAALYKLGKENSQATDTCVRYTRFTLR